VWAWGALAQFCRGIQQLLSSPGRILVLGMAPEQTGRATNVRPHTYEPVSPAGLTAPIIGHYGSLASCPEVHCSLGRSVAKAEPTTG